MLIKRRTGSLIFTALMIGSSLTACGSDTVTTVPQQQVGQLSQAELTKIIDRLDTISDKLDKLETVKPGTSTVIPKVTEPVKPTTVTDPKATTPTTTPAKTTTDSTDPKVRGRKILDTIIKTIKSANGIEAEVNKFEKNLKDGKTINHTMKLYTNKDELVRIDVLYASSGSSGVKVLYTSGAAGKVKVRPAGVLSLITTDLEKNDSRVVSSNGYTADDTDFYGMARRFSSPTYEAELIGTSKINNESVYVLNVTCKTDNVLDKRIKYEHISFEPKTFTIKSWEAFTEPNTDAFFKFDIKSFKILTSIPPESNFKI